MTIIEALKISDILRRKSSAKHRGSHGDGWVHVNVLLGAPFKSYLFEVPDCLNFTLTKADLLADDWEAKGGDDLGKKESNEKDCA